ncbi:hypothetical protein QQX98_009212 [Neonectria punicea]|uniref:Ankyrin repeat protein n=1 Tax=Neonectria punicea TaxID=979145 RepID=A0ABR1GT81_9HYPO
MNLNDLRRKTPFFKLAQDFMLANAEVLQRAGGKYDQAAWMEHLSSSGTETTLCESRNALHGNSRDAPPKMIDLLVNGRYEHILRHTQLQPLQRARQGGLAPGAVELTRHCRRYSPVTDALRHGHVGTVRALVALYLQSEPRHDAVQSILHHLADTWPDTWERNSERQYNRDNGFLYLADMSERLACLFLIATAPAHAHVCLGQHAQPLRAAVDAVHTPFAATLGFFLEHHLQTDIMDLEHWRVLRWADQKNHAPIADLLRSRGATIPDDSPA